MKTFLNLDKLTLDPCLSFGIADGDGDIIELTKEERQEVRTPAALIDASAMASELGELAPVVAALRCGQSIRVLRVDSRKVSPGALEPGFFDYLASRGLHVCLLADPNPYGLIPVPPLAEQFALCITQLLVPTNPLFCQLIGYMAATRDAGLSDELPHVLMSHDPSEWRFGPLSDFDDSFEFSKLVMDSCPSFTDTAGFINHLLLWLQSDAIEPLTFAQVMALVEREDPFAPWRRLAVPSRDRAGPAAY